MYILGNDNIHQVMAPTAWAGPNCEEKRRRVADAGAALYVAFFCG